MSRVAKATLGASLLGSALVIWGVHFLQERERDVRGLWGHQSRHLTPL